MKYDIYVLVLSNRYQHLTLLHVASMTLTSKGRNLNCDSNNMAKDTLKDTLYVQNEIIKKDIIDYKNINR